MKWTMQDRAELLRRQIEDGAKIADLAKQHGATYEAIRTQLSIYRKYLRDTGQNPALVRTSRRGPALHVHKEPARIHVDESRCVGASININIRMREQGLTAGFFGDPPPGRSALDTRGGRL